MKNTVQITISLISTFLVNLLAQGQPCSFVPFPPQGTTFNTCNASLTLNCPAMIAPDCGCVPDPAALPNILSGTFDLQFDTFPPGVIHLDTTHILFNNVPLAGCADVTINMTGFGDLSSRPFEDLIMIDENGNEICRVGGADCSPVQAVCTMRFCDFNLQVSGGIHWKILPNSLIADSTSFPFCDDNWVNVELIIPTSNIKAINNFNVDCGEIVQLPEGDYQITWTSYDKFTCDEITAIQVIHVDDQTAPQIMGCPIQDVVLNLGPGECEASWDAPPFIAMDNCIGYSYFSTDQVSQGCQVLPNTVWNPGYFGGIMFDIQNTSANPIAIHGFDLFWGYSGSDTASLFYTTIPGSHVPVRFNPNAWTQCPTKIAITSNEIPFPEPGIRFLDFRSILIRNSASCGGPIVSDTLKTGCPVLQPGEIRGLYICGLNGNSGAYWNDSECSDLAPPFGDANLKILKSPFASMVYGTGLFGQGGGLAKIDNQQFVGNVHYGIANNQLPVIQTCGLPYGPGCYFPIGCTTLCYFTTDASGNTATCKFDICVRPYPNPVHFLACHDEVQVSLDENCFATISADEILTGGPYKCFDEYLVEVRDWITNLLIDRLPNVPGAQVGVQDIGHEFKVTVIDTATGNSCWGHVVVEDKLPPRIFCPSDTTIVCGQSPTSPLFMGIPIIIENCGDYTLTYTDHITYGGCTLNFDHIISRKWIAIDASGNRSECTQIITINLITIANVIPPRNYDDLDLPSLSCDEKIEKVKDYSPHYLAYPLCVDGYLLDSAYWIATGGTAPNPLSGERLPRILGWNVIDTGLYSGHPSPWPVYYPAHPSWKANNPVCWGPDEMVMWAGTGYPSGSACRNLGISFEDIVIDVAKPGCDAGPVGCFKILRKWIILDWCSSEILFFNQVIKVIDKEGPQVVYPDSISILMDPFTCKGSWNVSPPWLADNCSNELHYTVEVDNGTVLGTETTGYVITEIEHGVWNAYIVAEDCCGNITRKRISINAQDDIPPNAVCDQKTVVSLTGNQSQGENIAKVCARDLDDGSFDNCAHHLFFKAIRMEHLLGTNNGSNNSQPDNGTNCTVVNGDDNISLAGNQIYFDDCLSFCCVDGGKTFMVVVRVFDRDPGVGPVAPYRMIFGGDLYGRFTDCMVEIEVQDKSIPSIIPPPDIVVSCWFWFDIESLKNRSDSTFGKMVNSLNQRKKVITKDLVCPQYCIRNDLSGYPGYIPIAPPSNPPVSNKACNYFNTLYNPAHKDAKYELVWGFDGVILGSCNSEYTISINDNRQCGQGPVTRTFAVRGPNGINITANQTIWVVDCDPFYINVEDPCDPDDHIAWPGNCNGQATTIHGCGADIDPDNPLLGRPRIENFTNHHCALISIEYYDEIFTIEPDACYKVLRHWTVIDWCQYQSNRNPEPGRWNYLQIIKVHDIEKPVITLKMGDCEPAMKNPADKICYAHQVLTADATDLCSPNDWLSFEYKIDLYNDGIGIHSGYDYVVGSLTKREYGLGKIPAKRHNPAADNDSNPFDASGRYPLGIHKICWFVEDGCGNLAIECKLFEIKDCKAPTPYCHVGIITTVMPSMGCITIWAKDLDAGSFDNCTESKNLKFYFKDNGSDNMTVCCDLFEARHINDELILPVTICVKDDEGNEDCCNTTIIIQDPQNVCPNVGTFGKITGELKTLTDEGTQDAEVKLLESAVAQKQMVTASNGYYTFGDLRHGAAIEYVIKPSRTDDPLNGVSTADIVKIQRHILGIENLNDPYKMIAADVNGSKTVTASDISEIRKLVLGVISKYSKMDSWTFVPKDYPIESNDPWSAPRQATVQMPTAQEVKEDFVAIKVGDVTNNARGHYFTSTTTRSNGSLQLIFDTRELKQGQYCRIPVRSKDFAGISGFQFTLKFDSRFLRFENYESGVLHLNESNWNTNKSHEGYLAISWNARMPLSLDDQEVLFELVFWVTDVNSFYNFGICDELTIPEAYDKDLNTLNVTLSQLGKEGITDTSSIELYQNQPNPFIKETTISYYLPKATFVRLSFYNANGKLLKVMEGEGRRGVNEVNINASGFIQSGLIYYQLDTELGTATKKMMILD